MSRQRSPEEELRILKLLRYVVPVTAFAIVFFALSHVLALSVLVAFAAASIFAVVDYAVLSVLIVRRQPKDDNRIG